MWLKFFFEGIKQTADSSITTFKEIVKHKEQIEQHAILTLEKKTKLAQQFIRFLYSKPSVDSSEVAVELLINISTALRLIEDFIRLDILKEVTGYKRNRIFIFLKYISLFE